MGDWIILFDENYNEISRTQYFSASHITGLAFAKGDLPPHLTANGLPQSTNISHHTMYGDISEGAAVTVSSVPNAEISDVTYPTLTSWECQISNLSVGDNVITITAENAEGADKTEILHVNYFLDIDNDSVPDTEDNCPYDYNPDQTDTDNDLYGDTCDDDDDNDGYTDQSEILAGTDPLSSSSMPRPGECEKKEKPKFCSDYFDNDCDYLIDSADSDCSSDEEPEPNVDEERQCKDGLDNDNDGSVDCEDLDCIDKPWCK